MEQRRLFYGDTMKTHGSTENNQNSPYKNFPEDSDCLMKEDIAADFFDVTKRAMQNWRCSGKGPKFVRISSRCIRYRKRDLCEWAEKLLRQNTSTNDAMKRQNRRRD